MKKRSSSEHRIVYAIHRVGVAMDRMLNDHFSDEQRRQSAKWAAAWMLVGGSNPIGKTKLRKRHKS